MTKASVDLGEFYAEGKKAGTACLVRQTLADLPPDKATLLAAALVERSISGGAIERTVAKWGVKLSYNSIRRHRAGQCNCGS